MPDRSLGARDAAENGLFELPELVKVFGGLHGSFEEGALFVPAQGESLQDLVEPDLFLLV